MSSGPQSGKFGILHGGNPLAAVTPMFNWNLNDGMATEVIYASNTRMGPTRNPGIEDWAGSFALYNGFPIVGSLPIMPGTILSVEFFTAPDTGIYGNTGNIYFGNIMVESVTITWQWLPSFSLNTVVGFSGYNCLSNKIGVIDDLTLDEPPRMCPLTIEYTEEDASGTPAWNPWNDVIQATLTFVNAAQPVINSATNCCTLRRSGNVDWTLTVTEQETKPAYDKGQNLSFRLQTTNAATYWILQWGQLAGYSGIAVDRTTGAIISKDATYEMTALKEGALGFIEMPNGANYWPPVATTETLGFGGINEPPWNVS